MRACVYVCICIYVWVCAFLRAYARVHHLFALRARGGDTFRVPLSEFPKYLLLILIIYFSNVSALGARHHHYGVRRM